LIIGSYCRWSQDLSREMLRWERAAARPSSRSALDHPCLSSVPRGAPFAPRSAEHVS
jgi:hypothetical protein